MPSEVKAEIHGLNDLRARLIELGPELAQEILKPALAAAEKVLGEALLERTPKRSGELASHLITTSQIAPSGTAGIAKAGFGSEGYKARLVELGHRQVTHKPGLQEVGHVPAHPFMRPASEASKDDCKQAVIEAARIALEKL